MVEKNQKKQTAKKYRNLWIMNPRTRRKENKKKYNRNKEKQKSYSDY